MIPLPRVLRVCSLLACATVLGMVAIFLTTGIGQDPLQFVHPPEDYARLLLAAPATLRLTVGLDNCFIAFYSVTFVALALLLVQAGAPRALVWVALSLLLFLGLLDMAENFHFMVMLSGAEAGQVPSAGEIGLQVWESLLKFHVGYLGVFLLGFAIPRETWQGRWLSRLALYVQLPVGILIYVAPHALAVPLVFARFTFFVAALALVGWAVPPRAVGSGARA